MNLGIRGGILSPMVNEQQINIDNTNSLKLPRRFRNKLIRALRSDRYQQHTGDSMKTHRHDNYTPIGVAYRLAGVHKGTITKMGQPSNKRFNFLPNVLTDSNSPVVQKLNALNKKNNFRWIASYIEDRM